MSFEEIAIKYNREFGEMPPELATLSNEDELYLEMLQEAIDEGTPLTRDDLAKVFMTDEKAVY